MRRFEKTRGRPAAPGLLRRWLLILLLGVSAVSAACRHRVAEEVVATDTRVVELAQGRLRGGSLDGVAVFKNIPYAQPPVGLLRWRPPQPAPSWSGDRDATRYGNDCMQNRMSWDSAMSAQPLSEDCLYLNVWLPDAALADGRKRAVMVWIHGGAYASGSANSPITAGEKLAREDVVVVAMNYRLGRFGFFAHPALRQAGRAEALGNYGTQDQIAALRWVRDNVQRFGGDPARVTIFGESAGGDAVQQLMLSSEARGLFAQAIAQSGGGRSILPLIDRDLPSIPSAENRGVRWVERLKLHKPDVGALLSLPAEVVLGKISLVEWDKEHWASVVVDGKTIASNLMDGFSAGRQARVPFMVGANGFELGGLPAMYRRPMSRALYSRFGDQISKVQVSYPDEDAFDVGFISDFSFVEPARRIARHASARQPTFLYRFNYVPEDKRRSWKGAPHFADVPFIFGHLEETGMKISPQDREISLRVRKLWAGFAKTGRPTDRGLPDWSPYSDRSDRLFEISNDGQMAMSPAGAPWLDAIGTYVSGTAAPR